MKLITPFYLGYAQLQDWASVVDARKPVYAMPYTESRMNQFTRIDRSYILFAQPHGNEMHYCRIAVSLTEWIDDKCVSPNATERQERISKAWAVLRLWLEACELTVREAVPAWPNDYVFTEGVADFLRYTSERGYFIDEGVPA